MYSFFIMFAYAMSRPKYSKGHLHNGDGLCFERKDSQRRLRDKQLYTSQEIDKESDDDRIADIDKDNSDHRQHKPGCRCGTVLFNNSTHIGHGIGSLAKTDTAMAGSHNCCIIVTASDIEGQLTHRYPSPRHKESMDIFEEELQRYITESPDICKFESWMIQA